MDDVEKYCLKWNEYETNLSSSFRQLLEEKELFDVTILCQDHQIQAHRVILSASSPFFKTVFGRNPHPHPLIYLKDVKLEIIQLILKFIYEGQVNVNQKILQSFLTTAADLKIKGLTQDAKKKENNYENLTKSVKRKISPTISTTQSISKAIKHETVEDPVENGDQQLHSQVDLDYEDVEDGYDDEEKTEFQGNHHQDFQHYDVEDISEVSDELNNLATDVNIPGADIQNINLAEYYSPVQLGQQCRLCGHLSQTKRLIKVHLEGKHGLSLGYTCDICNKFLKTNEALRIHKRRRHRVTSIQQQQHTADQQLPLGSEIMN